MDELEAPTQVTGSPTGASAPRRGDVVGERYEVREFLERDPFTTTYKAFDQETETSVLLRMVPPDLIPSGSDRQVVARRLGDTVGVGGRFLPGLIDADRDGLFVFTVEAMPPGAALRSVIDQRVAGGRTLDAEELLPVLARVDAALRAIPPPLCHGDLRAERIWFDPDGLQLLGAFLLPSLPPASLAQAVEAHPRLSRVLAPEALRGAAGDAADRFGAAMLAHEALTGELPVAGASANRELGPIGEAIAALLAVDPRRRPATLEGLIEAVARVAGLPVPDLDPGGFRRPRRLALPRRPAEPTRLDGDRIEPDDQATGRRAPPAGSDALVTLEDEASTLEDEDTGRRTPPRRPEPPAGGDDDSETGRRAPPAAHRTAKATVPGAREVFDEVTAKRDVPIRDEPDDAATGRRPAPSAEETDALTAVRAPADDATRPRTPIAKLQAHDAEEQTRPRFSAGPADDDGATVTRRAAGEREVGDGGAIAAWRPAPPALAPTPSDDEAVTGRLAPAEPEALDDLLSLATGEENDATSVRSASGAQADGRAPRSGASLPGASGRRARKDTLEQDDPPSFLMPPVDAVMRRRIAGADPSGTQEITADQLLLGDDEDAAPSRDSDGSLDPRLVRAALGVTLEDLQDDDDPPTLSEVPGAADEDDEGLDPRLVRAALGVSLDDSGAHDAVKRDPTLELDALELEPIEPPPKAPPAVVISLPVSAPLAGPPRPRPLPPPEPTLQPADPGPTVEVDPPPEALSPIHALPSLLRPAVSHAMTPTPPSQERPMPPGMKRRDREATAELSRRERAARAGRRRARNPGRIILLVSIVLAALIIAGSLLYAGHRRTEQQREEERRLQERWERLQQDREAGPAVVPTAPDPSSAR